jgi:hypothetical protein
MEPHRTAPAVGGAGTGDGARQADPGLPAHPRRSDGPAIHSRGLNRLADPQRRRRAFLAGRPRPSSPRTLVLFAVAVGAAPLCSIALFREYPFRYYFKLTSRESLCLRIAGSALYKPVRGECGTEHSSRYWSDQETSRPAGYYRAACATYSLTKRNSHCSIVCGRAHCCLSDQPGKCTR